MNIEIIKDKCTGCSLCIKNCSYNAIVLINKKAVINSNCTFCKSCLDTCKFGAISINNVDSSEFKDNSSYSGIWVLVEQYEGEIEAVTYELIGEAVRLAKEIKASVSTILLGNHCDSMIKELTYYGAEIVYVVESNSLEDFNDEIYSDIVTKLASQYKPEVLLIGATVYGRSVAPRIASQLNTGLTADCTELAMDIKKRLLLQTRPAFGGNKMATISTPYAKPQMATVRPKIMNPLEKDLSRKSKVINIDFESFNKNYNTVIKKRIKNKDVSMNLADSDVIISVGRGIGNKENLKLIKELASLMGAAIGATRPLVDEGIIEITHQVGQTGKTVKPKIYFALGISGAIQHVAGMSGADTIIAVNSDPNAPIFNVAHFGIVEDAMEVIKQMISSLKK